MTNFVVVLKSLRDDGERIVLSEPGSREYAEAQRKNWRRTLGGKAWTVERRPGLDTLDHLGLKIELYSKKGE